jgi:hypothetical protein
MATILKFAPADVVRVCEHAMNAKDWRKAIESYGDAPDYKATYKPAEIAVCLVHDSGVYLMSAGLPRDPVDPEAAKKNPESFRSFVAYAKGMNPDKDEEWYDTARDAVGGDDFGEFITGVWVDSMLRDAKAGLFVRISFGRNSMRLLPGSRS